eukprot:2239720-Karenia_brevis.AAC.1
MKRVDQYLSTTRRTLVGVDCICVFVHHLSNTRRRRLKCVFVHHWSMKFHHLSMRCVDQRLSTTRPALVGVD